MFDSLRSRLLAMVTGGGVATATGIAVLAERQMEMAMFAAADAGAFGLLEAVVLDVRAEYGELLHQRAGTLEERKAELKDIVGLAHSLMRTLHARQQRGELSESQAREMAAAVLRELRYDKGAGYVWANDTGRPFPRMIMHPAIPELDGQVLDNPGLDGAQGQERNPYVAFVDVCLAEGEGFVEYLWPKPTEDGLTRRQPKLSHVRLFEPWGWVVGAGLYVAEIEEDVEQRLDEILDELREALADLRVGESGYMFMFNGRGDMLIHPTQQGADTSRLINPQTGNPILEDLVAAARTPGTPLEYLWDKPPTHVGDFSFRKHAYVAHFGPLDWYIASSAYTDEIERAGLLLGRKILVLSGVFLAVGLLLSLRLSRSLAKPLLALTAAARQVRAGRLGGTPIPVTGTSETRELGLALGETITALAASHDELTRANQQLTREIDERQRTEKERHKLETQLRQTQKMEAVGQLAGGVAHDFNNILTAIMGNVDLALMSLRRQVPGDDSLLDGLRQIQQEAERAAGLTRQLLAFGRRQVSRPGVFDLNQTIAELEKMLGRLLTEDIELRTFLPPGVSPIRADSGQIEQVIINLVINARDAMPKGGHLTLETANVLLDEGYVASHTEARGGPHVRLTVSDTGHGMDQETIERIFEPFFTTKPTGHGTGLGLSSAYGIVRQARGHIRVYSEPGRGTTFQVYLPATEAALEAREPAAEPTRDPTGTETILVSEDNDPVRRLAIQVLSEARYTVLSASGGAEARQRAEEHDGPIQLLLTDVVMPDTNGKELFEKLSAVRPELRTLFMSGYTANVIAHHGVLNEGVEFLEKPFSRHDLLRRVREVLDRAQSGSPPR